MIVSDEETRHAPQNVYLKEPRLSLDFQTYT